jgi:carbon storage regulator CsrA
MLVLSRRPGEKILLPTVPAVIKVISSQAGLVRIGIQAPSHVAILREEVSKGEGTSAPSASPGGSESGPASAGVANPAIQNRLDNLSLALTMLRMHLAENDPVVRRMLDGMEAEVRVLGVELAAPHCEPEPRTGRRPRGARRNCLT